MVRVQPCSLQLARLAVCAALAIGGAAAAGAERNSQLLPIDQATLRPDFFSFRARLQTAIARRDHDALLAIVDPMIKNSFGGDDGIEEFRKGWRPEAADSTLWSELGEVLALGGTFDQPRTTFTAPYVFSRWPGDYDAFEHVAIISADVRVRAAPRIDAPPLTALSFTIVPTAPSDLHVGAEIFTAIRLSGGRVGYVSTPFVRSPIDYRAIFELRADGWRMVSFLAGD
jgi:hypothetical protein